MTVKEAYRKHYDKAIKTMASNISEEARRREPPQSVKDSIAARWRNYISGNGK